MKRNSSSCQPTQTPSRVRLPENSYSVAISFASRIGWWSGTSTIEVPSPTAA
jgi:hypothetical protein